MRNRLLLSVATAALIAGAGLASAQTMSPGREAPSPAPAAQQNAPAEKTAPMNAPKGGAEIKAPDAGAKKTGQVDDKVRKDGKDQRAQDKADPKAGSTAQKDKADPKAGSTAQKEKPADAKPSTSGQGTSPKSSDKSSEKPADAKPSAAGQDAKPGDAKPSTAGQGAAAPASLSTEQRTTIRTVIQKQNVQRMTNVNFTISVGTKVPSTGVRFYPVPVELVQIYPSWRGYDFILVGDQIIVVNPRTHEIVAVLDA
jgi:Protein of unknown function (DUF1236)